MNKAFFLDRDGVLNNSIYKFDNEYKKLMDCAPESIDEFKLTENAKTVVNYIKDQGFLPIVITNQSIFLKNNIPLINYEQITSKLCSELELQRNQVFECLHKPGFSLDCNCRKPESGLFLMAKGLYDLDLENSWMIGDSARDIFAAKNAGIENTIFLRRPKIQNHQEGNEKDFLELKNNVEYVVNDLRGILALV